MNTLENNPRLRELLIEHTKMQYEQQADLSEESLIQEYYALMRNNSLHELFELEAITTEWEELKRLDEVRTAYFNLLTSSYSCNLS